MIKPTPLILAVNFLINDNNIVLENKYPSDIKLNKVKNITIEYNVLKMEDIVEEQNKKILDQIFEQEMNQILKK